MSSEKREQIQQQKKKKKKYHLRNLSVLLSLARTSRGAEKVRGLGVGEVAERPLASNAHLSA